MPTFTLCFTEISKQDLPLVGGKGANLGEISKISTIKVPLGFCVTTEAYQYFVTASPVLAGFLDQLNNLAAENSDTVQLLGQRIRQHMESLPVPDDIRRQINQTWQETGEDYAYAVRSSATAEDLPGASFAGQQDTYLNIQGIDAIVEHVRKCWASLFSDRAIVYRARNGFDHKKVLLAVVVQQMIFPEVSGIMFTADPVNGNRKVVSIDAGFGLGEALVSGMVTADLYKVKENKILTKQIGDKKIAVYAAPAGGTREQSLPDEMPRCQALTDDQVLTLAAIGKHIERHFAAPQDIEWCFADGIFYVVQSRPITTLYPLPEIADNGFHVFSSFGHQQMMTDPMKPLGLSLFQFSGPYEHMLVTAGGRLFGDITRSCYPQKKQTGLASMDALMGSAVEEIKKRHDLVALFQPEGQPRMSLAQLKKLAEPAMRIVQNMAFNDASSSSHLYGWAEKKIAETQQTLRRLSGADRIRFINKDKTEMLTWVLHGKMMGPFMAGMISFKLIDRLSKRWLGDSKETEDLGKSPPRNNTSEMGLALGDLADIIRQYPAVIAYLHQSGDNTLLTGLETVEGGRIVKPVFEEFLRQYGLRCTGEIDITRPRWREKPGQLIPAILSHIQSVQPGEHRRKFAEGEKRAEEAAKILSTRLKKITGGAIKAKIMAKLTKTYRGLAGFREYPKYFIVSHFDLYKKAIMEEAEKLVYQGVLKQTEDVYYLSLTELEQVIRSAHADQQLIADRKEKYQEYEKLTPPRVMTSEGEIIYGSYGQQDAPPGALPGIPVSAGVVEGRARIILKPEQAKLDKGDILVATFTDPGWTPFFVSASGVVTEVGGLMTHGAIVAREYGIPAVVGVQQATSLIQDGQKIRVNGTKGYIELLDDSDGKLLH
ncbi:phosphoenolpyruvate synthase|uniref:Rifampicin phosphotransferase n=1 Tax=Dendrosporobacter quercicolus TaxID=146817 RepID=A0A1G9X9L1_9FIRM|nr:rifamycin-inactivating phosphotransferase [Dendrosporobacter quercicolus]NSL49907.1 phosphoenolpyruvate synthase [Dendrosporobacter quercicolus DSM 1736]SDM93424.1 pyruvate, water dikinase [Dendrosporobacter quercicolus]